MEYIELGPTPSAEDCVQVSREVDYYPAMMEEAERYMKMLEEKFPDAECTLRVKTFPHEFGEYAEVVACYGEWNTTAREHALFIEHYIPKTWKDTEVIAMPEVKLCETCENTLLDCECDV